MRKETDDVITMVERFQFKPDPEHLPLANTPGRFLDLMMYLKEKSTHTESTATLAEVFSITPRQISFYAETGDRTFGLFDRTVRGQLSLTTLGVGLAEKSRVEQISYLQHKVMKLPLFRQMRLKKEISVSDVIEMVSQDKVFRARYSDSSIKRRAGTLIAWVKWFEATGLPLDDSEIASYIAENQNLIYEVVHQYDNRKENIEEYFSVASIGFQNALLHYNPDRDTKFSTFAYTCMKNEIFMFKRKEKRYNPFKHDSLDVKAGFYDEDIMTSAFNHCAKDSLEERLTSGEESPEEHLLKIEQLEWIEENLKNLSPRNRKIMEMYYMDGETQKTISEHIKMSQANISKIMYNSIQYLKQKALESSLLSNY